MAACTKLSYADMRLPEFYKNQKRPILSFEVFPPKTEEAFTNLKQVLRDLVALKPDYMTVTYGAFGSTRGRTLEIASLIQNEYKIPSACHLTCVGSSATEI